MFSILELAKLMRWQPQNRNTDNKMRCVADSQQWKFIDENFASEFASDDRNIRLGLATDGINPFSF